tara:strand:- start:255 stop:1856 length:1602 start_codon:yes stop_codon:yes gene_type:complete
MKKIQYINIFILLIQSSCINYHRPDFKKQTFVNETLGIKNINITDINNDNKNDVVYNNIMTGELTYLENIDNFNFEQKNLFENIFCENLIVNDINNDGIIDLIISDSNGLAIATKSEVNGINYTFTNVDSSNNNISKINIADINGDNKNDIVCSSILNHTIGWYENIGNLEFNYYNISDTLNGLSCIVVSDINNDKLDDIIYSSIKDENIVALINSKDQTFSSLNLSKNTYSKAIGIYDIDNNGKKDLIYSSSLTNNIHIVKNILRDKKQIDLNYINSSLVEQLAIGDINNDGEKDIILQENHGNGIIVLEQRSGLFYSKLISLFSNILNKIDIVDFDNDGDNDIIYSSNNLGEISILKNTLENDLSISYLKSEFESINQNINNYAQAIVTIVIISILLFLIKKNMKFKRLIIDSLTNFQKIQKDRKLDEIIEINKSDNSIKSLKLSSFLQKNKDIDSEFIFFLKNKKLSKGEIRTCILINSEINNNEVSNILGISTKSLYMKRHRISKKLGLKSSKDLYTFLSKESIKLKNR